MFIMGLAEKANYMASQVQSKTAKQQREAEEEKKNRNFVQLYRPQIDNVTELAFENPTAFRLLMFLIKNMDYSNALCVSNTALQEVMELSKPTICRAIKYLKDNGWVCVLKQGTSNVYVINPDVAWTAYENQKQYCKFNATVFLSGSENAEYLKNPNATTHFKTVSEDFMKQVRDNRISREETFRELTGE